MKRLFFTLSLIIMFFCRGMALNVYMTGDSHVCSNFYPETVGDILVDGDPEIDFSYWGKIGASFETFNTTPDFMERIYKAKPEILIVHLGTNDCYSDPFKRDWFLDNLTEFYESVSQRFPDCKFVFVTPFFNKFKNGKLNPYNRDCADAYLEFQKEHDNVFVVDNNADFGMCFLDGGAKLIRHDNVHLTEEGYKLLGEQVAQAIIDLDTLWENFE